MSDAERPRVAFEMRGLIEPDKLEVIAGLLGPEIAASTVSVIQWEDPLMQPGAGTPEHAYDERYVTIREEDGNALVTRTNFGNFFRDQPDEVTEHQVSVGWGNLKQHARKLHDPVKGDRCGCGIEPIFTVPEQPDETGFIEPVLIGFGADGLRRVKGIVAELPNGDRHRIEKRPAELIERFIDRVLQVKA